MFLQCVLLVAGLVFVVLGADLLVDGASSVARRFGLSEFVIGLTIVGIGTSAPEMVVSFIGAAKGNADIAVGNVVGSNIMNTLLILGLTAMILPMDITPLNRKRDMPVNLVVTVILIFLGMEYTLFGWGTEDGLSRVDGAIMLLLFVAYMMVSFLQKGQEEAAVEEQGKQKSVGVSLLYILGGLVGLVVGGRLFVDSATDIARALHVSDKFIAVTILAGGTSMPELATCLVAAAKKKGQLALGNIIGSNVFNILLILGGSALIHPLSFAHIGYVDLGVVLVSAILLYLSEYTGIRHKLDRFDASLFLLVWLLYFVNLFNEL